MASLFGRKQPIDFDGGGVAPGLPSQRFVFESFLGADARVEVLAGKGGDRFLASPAGRPKSR